MDLQKKIMEIQRHDSNAPLERFRFPKIKSLSDKLQNKYELPDQFLRFSTLREGTFVITLYFNLMAAGLSIYLLVYLYPYHEDMETWWKDKFREDFDYYWQGENQEFINTLYPLWEPFAWAIIAVKTVYFITGLFNFYALKKKTRSPNWYLPWIIMTGLLCGIMWLLSFVLFISLFVFIFYRPITVTWDIMPIFCVGVYAYGWCYCLFVVFAHYKRRGIVKYWRDRGVILMADGSLKKKQNSSIEY